MTRHHDAMKVLVVIDSLGLGGAENLLTVLAGPGASAGLQLHVASLTPSSLGRVALQEQMQDAGLTTSFLDVPRLLHPSALTAVGREIRRVNADVVHAHLGYSAVLAPLAARTLRRGIVSTLHHVPEDLSPRETLKERMAVEIAGHLGALVFVSEASRLGFAERYRERNLIGRRHSERFGEPPAIIRRAPGRRTPCPADVAGGRLTPSTPQEG